MMANFIDESIYNNYFGIQEQDSDDVSIAPKNKRNFVYADSKASKIHTNEKTVNTDGFLNLHKCIADDNIDDLEKLADILKKLCNAAWGSDWGELSPDLKKGEDSSNIIVPQITLDINTRDVAEGIGGIKPTLIDIIKETDENGNETGDAFLIYRQWYDTNVEFNIYGRNNREARQLQKKFENLLNVYTGYLKRHGISEMFFEREVSAKFSSNYNESIPMRCIYYYIRFENITPIRQSLINSINLKIGANQLDADKVKTLISNSRQSEAVELDFFDGDNGITYDLEQ